MIEGKRATTLLVLRTLAEYTDSEHYITQQEICDLILEDYGVELERKSVARSISMLEELDYDIGKGKPHGFALLSRYGMDESEVTFLVDAIFSSKAIPGKYARSLADNISKHLLSRYQRPSYDYLHKCTGVNRTKNKDVFYNIGVIQEAIRKKKWIAHRYMAYDRRGKLIPRKDGYIYHTSPCYLVNSNGFYYLLGFRNGRNAVLTFRIDYMSDIEIMDERARIEPSDLEEFKGYKSITEYMNDHIYLFSSKVVDAKLRLAGEYAIAYVKDWFGDSAKLSTEDDSIYVDIRCDEDALYYWAMQYANHITVLSPDSVRERIKESAEKMLKTYE